MRLCEVRQQDKTYDDVDVEEVLAGLGSDDGTLREPRDEDDVAFGPAGRAVGLSIESIFRLSCLLLFLPTWLGEVKTGEASRGFWSTFRFLDGGDGSGMDEERRCCE